MKRIIKGALKIGVSGALLWLLFHYVDVDEVKGAWHGMDRALAACAPVLVLVGLVAAAARWRYLMRHYGMTIPLSMCYRWYLVGYFFNACLPGHLGGDAVRVGQACAHTRRHYGSIATIAVIERFFGVCGILIYGLIGMALGHAVLAAHLPPRVFHVSAVVGMVFLAGLLLLGPAFRAAHAALEKRGSWPGLQRIARETGALSSKDYFTVLGLSMAYQLSEMTASYCLLLAFHLTLPFMAFMPVYAAVSILLLIPMSIGGLGVREGLLIYMLGRLGLPEAGVLMYSLSTHLNRVLVGVAGGGLHVLLPAHTNEPGGAKQ